MKYDPTRTSLYYPETGDPVPGFSVNWEPDQICAELSRLCYYRFDDGDAKRLENALDAAGFSGPKYFCDKKEDAQAFGTVGSGAAFVVFRGTQGGKIKDLIKDIDTPLVTWDGRDRVHRGFRNAFQSLQGSIDDWLAGRPAAERLIVTGHSLGAAMATLMAARHERAQLVTFGSPRVGDAAFAAQFEGREIRRYVDCSDMVTMVPPGLLGFVHAGDMLYIDRFGAVHAKAPDASAVVEDRQLGRRFYRKTYAWRFWRNVVTRYLADHTPINYVSALRRVRDPES